MFVGGVCFLALLCPLASSSSSCAAGRDASIGDSRSSSSVGVVNLLRGEDVAWFYETYVIGSSLPLLLQPSEDEEFLPKAVTMWSRNNGSRLTEALGAEIARFYSGNEEGVGSMSGDAALFRAPLPEQLKVDLVAPNSEMDFWKWVPCFGMRPEERGFHMDTHILVSRGNVSTAIEARGLDVFLWVAEGTKKCTLFPPWDAAVLNATRTGPGQWNCPPPSNLAALPHLFIQVPRGWFLFVPLGWFYSCVDHCRTVSIEVSLDVRGVMHEPYATRYFANSSVSPHLLWAKMRDPSALGLTKCREISKHFLSQERIISRQRVTTLSLSLGIFLTLATFAYLIWGLLREEGNHRKINRSPRKRD